MSKGSISHFMTLTLNSWGQFSCPHMSSVWTWRLLKLNKKVLKEEYLTESVNNLLPLFWWYFIIFLETEGILDWQTTCWSSNPETLSSIPIQFCRGNQDSASTSRALRNSRISSILMVQPLESFLITSAVTKLLSTSPYRCTQYTHMLTLEGNSGQDERLRIKEG